MEEINEITEQRAKGIARNPASVAAGMIWEDRGKLARLAPLCALPSIIATTMRLPAEGVLALVLLQRVVALLFLYFIGIRWARTLGRYSGSFSIPGLLLALLFGSAPWLGVGALSLVAQAFPGGLNELLVFIALGVVLLFAYESYFYSIPVVLGLRSPRQIFASSRSLVSIDRLLPIKIEVIAHAFALLPSVLIMAQYPDGRIAWQEAAATLFAQLAWIVSSYLCVAWGLCLLDERSWHEAKLEPYRDARLSTFSMCAPEPLAATLRPRLGGVVLALAGLVWAGNYLRLVNTPPPAETRLLMSTVQGQRAVITLQLIDPTYNLRGLEPARFLLAGERGTPLAPFPTEATVDGASVLGALPARSEATLRLSFETPRAEQELRSLRDLFLWYRGVRMFKVEFEPAGATPSASQQGSAADRSTPAGTDLAGSPSGS